MVGLTAGAKMGGLGRVADAEGHSQKRARRAARDRGRGSGRGRPRGAARVAERVATEEPPVASAGVQAPEINMAEYDEEENPFADIDEYIEDTNAIVPLRVDAATFKDNVKDDALRLRVFKYSLAGEARKWIKNLPPHSIHSWPELVRAFLAKWFPQSKKSELRDKIFFFKQLPGEHLHEAWDRFKLYLVRSPNHDFPDTILLKIFYMGLDPLNQSIAKNAADGSLMDKKFTRISQILDKMAEHNQAWHSEDTMGGIAYGTPSLTNMIKENQERDQIARRQTISIILKVVTKDNPTKVLDNKINGGLTRKGKAINSGEMIKVVQVKGQYSNPSHWMEGSSSESKLENMLERVLQNQKRNNTSMNNMAELVESHTASIQNLEMQMRDLSKEQNPQQKGALPSDTIANLKGNGSSPTSHCMAITTRSGKILQGENEQIVEVDDLEQEGEAQVEVPVAIEVEKLPKEVKVQEANSEEQLSVIIPVVEAFQEMLGFAKYLKDLITKKKTTENEVVNVAHRVSSVIATTTVQKKEDPGAFTIPCTIGLRDFARALCDNGASINLMPFSIYKQAGLGMPRPTSMRLQMADRSIKRPVGIVDGVLVKVGKFLLPVDFVILDCAVDKEIPIILGRPFLATGRALMVSE
nr:uncharacterized protein LOC104119332 [Nicotiana tomentosiformis]